MFTSTTVRGRVSPSAPLGLNLRAVGLPGVPAPLQGCCRRCLLSLIDRAMPSEMMPFSPSEANFWNSSALIRTEGGTFRSSDKTTGFDHMDSGCCIRSTAVFLKGGLPADREYPAPFERFGLVRDLAPPEVRDVKSFLTRFPLFIRVFSSACVGPLIRDR